MQLQCELLGKEWKVTLVYDLPPETNGRTLFPHREIELRDDFDINVTSHILLHELTHAYMFECGYQQLDSRDIPMSQEFFCEFMAIHGYDIVDTHKALMKLIKGIQKKRKVV